MSKKLPGLFLLFICAFLYLDLFQNALIDDSYITLDYVRSITRNGVWGITPDHITNTATSPLNVILLSILGLIFGVSTRLPIILAAICFVCIFFFLDRIAVQQLGSKAFGWMAAFLLFINPLLISTLGMESILFSTLIIIALYCFICKRWICLAIAVGFLILTRIDGILLGCVVMFFIPFRKSRMQFCVVLLLTTLPWFLFSWVHLGSFIPDTFFIKTLQSHWGQFVFSDGIQLYFQRYPLESLLSFFFFPSFIAFFIPSVRNVEIMEVMILFGISHFLGYTILDVPPYHWYYTPEIIIATIFGCFCLGYLYKSTKEIKWLQLLINGIIILCLIIPVAGMGKIFIDQHFKLKEMPIHTNRASQEQYKQVGIWIRDNCANRDIELNGEIGTISYYCDCNLMDWFSNRSWLIKIVDEQVQGNGLVSRLFRFNYLFLNSDLEYPNYFYKLTAYGEREKASEPFIIRWETSTRWSPRSLVTLSFY